jgi:hypothetical protein
VSRRPETGILILAFLGGLLLVYLTLPLVYLFFQIDWHELNTIFADPRTARAVKVSLVTSVVATAIMTTLGVPLGYLLARTVPRPAVCDRLGVRADDAAAACRRHSAPGPLRTLRRHRNAVGTVRRRVGK